MRIRNLGYSITLLLVCLNAFSVINSADSYKPKTEKFNFLSRLNNQSLNNMTNIKIPKVDSSGHFIPTLNRTGYMTTSLDPYSQEFVSYAAHSLDPVLEIGAAYGIATLAALEQGATVYCNDIEVKHLEIVAQLAKQKDFNRLKLVPGAFPKELNFPDNSFKAILIARVLHFFDPETLEISIKKTYEWLKPGGKLVIVADTPYLKNFAKFIPEYERRVKNKEKWPGIMDNPKKYVNNPNFPDFIHLLDADVLTRILLKQGFVIEKIGALNRTDYPADRRLDGRESVGVIAQKPLNGLKK